MRRHSSIGAPTPPCSPNVIAPSASSETRNPVRPNVTYLMTATIQSVWSPSPDHLYGTLRRVNARRDDPQHTGADLRERILSALRDLLRERTFDSLSVAEIISAAGVSRASFYFYFPGKQ